MSMKEVLKNLDLQLQASLKNYNLLFEELNPYRGKPLDEAEVVTVNNILHKIQDIFYNELYPLYHFIGLNYQSAVNSTTSFHEFIDELKKAGATQNGAASA